ncbi:MAG: hypothetical protein HY879_03150 [Deltaproteobacteria bacterium]|nr:hypothetical protein [Deltaproteobacteria bacterium]
MDGIRIVDYLSEILRLITLIQAYDLNSKYSEKDVRRTFFAKMANALRVYYLGHDFEFIASKLHSQRNYPAEEVPHIENLGWILPVESNARFLDTYHSILKLHLLNGSWVCFESSLDEIFKSLTSLDNYEKIQLRKYHDIIKLLGKSEIDDKLDERLRKLLFDKYIPAHNKWNAIFRLNYPTDRDLKQDRIFLEFFASCRNCMHNNSISFKTAHFETRFGAFGFTEGIAISFINGNLSIKMVGELVEIYRAMCSAIDFREEIVDPYSEQVEGRVC